MCPDISDYDYFKIDLVLESVTKDTWNYWVINTYLQVLIWVYATVTQLYKYIFMLNYN